MVQTVKLAEQALKAQALNDIFFLLDNQAETVQQLEDIFEKDEDEKEEEEEEEGEEEGEKS